MQLTNSSPLELARQPYVWLLALAGLVSSVYLSLLWRIEDVAHLGMSGLFLMAAASLIWDRRSSLTLHSHWLPSSLGAGLVLLSLGYSHYLVGLDSAHFSTEIINLSFFACRLSPFISLLGVALLMSGFRHLRQFWRELAIIAAMGIPSMISTTLSDISPITARFTHFLLSYSGIDAVLKDNIYIYLSLGPNTQGAVKVYEACSGLESMNYLFGLSIVCLIMFPLRSRVTMALVPFAAVSLAFVINSFRVMLMAILTALQNKESFDYWHDGPGSLSFGLFAVLALGGVYMLLMNHDEHQRLKARSARGEGDFSTLKTKDDYLLPPDLQISLDDIDPSASFDFLETLPKD
ncbi:cyanoexosortase A [Prochlorothrix hollandica]|uniref:cyanoexosortase A n=1 Tax=Prochlorothrix hollandica TaxID=1223 RepID=UPI0033410677